MFFALLILVVITLGGFVVTYLYDRDAPLLVRLAAGTIIGQAIFALAAFLVGMIAGMSPALPTVATIFAALPLAALIQKDFAARVKKDVAAGAANFKNLAVLFTVSKVAWAAVWLGLVIFLAFYFGRAMFTTSAGAIATGSPHNLGDLSFHLQIIYGFLEGQNFPPQNPSFAGTKFTYPFMVDLVAAGLAAAGAKISEAMFWQNMFLIIALVVLLRRLTLKLTGSEFAANIAPFILLFSGGFGFYDFFQDALANPSGAVNYLFQMSENYTIRHQSVWRWGNSLTVLFMTQRSLLFGMPLVLIVLTKVWEIFSGLEQKHSENTQNNEADFVTASPRLSVAASFIVGLLAGMLPLVHAHSFAVVMGVTALLAVVSWEKWRAWLGFFAGSAVIAVPELLWAITGSASRAQSFLAYEFGWDNNGELSFAFFWLINTGLFIPLLLAAILFLTVKSANFKTENPDERSPLTLLLIFWLPFALCFIVPNMFRLAPWMWDNIKVLIYWFLFSIPLVAWLLAQIWERGAAGKTAALGLLLILMMSGWLDAWRVASGQMEYAVFERDAVILAREARRALPPDAVVASVADFASPAALMGRRWFLGYVGHIWSHGINPYPREKILKEIYAGSPNADNLLRENNIQYLVVSPEEYKTMIVNEIYLRRFPVVVQSGDYRLIQVR